MDSLYLTTEAVRRIKAEIAKARGNEVCFVASVAEDGGVGEPRVVARGHKAAVLAAVRDSVPGQIVLHNHPSGTLQPSNADLEVASRLYDNGLGFAIVDNDATEMYVVLEPALPKELFPLDPEEVAAHLAPGGAISGAHGMYEDRPSQRDLSRAVTRAYNEGGVAVLEAGTGTGKSIAYLIPAIYWSLRNRERTVISTNTINLQEQLVRKDLPFLHRTLGEKFRFALVKGRGNYISIRRAKLAQQTQMVLFDDQQQSSLTALMEWMNSTEDGSLQDMPFTPGSELWDEVVSDSDFCLGVKCPHFSTCFYQKARQNASNADILVANHSLLFSDIAVRRLADNYNAPAVLPVYKRVILDEAHNVEDAATDHLGGTISRRGIVRILSRLDRRGKGLLGAIEAKLLTGKDDLLQSDALKQITKLRTGVESTLDHTYGLFHFVEDLTSRPEDGIVRLDDEFLCSAAWTNGMDVAYENLLTSLAVTARGLGQLRDTVMVDQEWSDKLTEHLLELHGAAGRLQQTADALRLVFTGEGHSVPLVRWLERRGGREPNYVGRAAPVTVAEALRDALFDRMQTTVLTSATLATRDGFSFVRSRLGITNGLRVREGVFPSPFDYEEQTRIVIPTDGPSPRTDNDPAMHRYTTEVVSDFAEITDGGIFVLFTSYRALKAVAINLRKLGIERRWPLFVQGESPRSQLLDKFVTSGRGILLGVSSFWEGVDVPGDPLRGIVISKLPFKVPTEPLTGARIEAIENSGGNSFMDYMVPHAALRLKQGFGRLIRSSTDHGAVVLLDRRVIEKGYGKYFIDTLPPTAVLQGPWISVSEKLLPFYASRASLPKILT